MTVFNIEPKNLNKWLHQNRPIETIDCIEGCLLDNIYVGTKRGFAMITEQYVNAYSSTYKVEWEKGLALNLFNKWCKLRDEMGV